MSKKQLITLTLSIAVCTFAFNSAYATKACTVNPKFHGVLKCEAAFDIGTCYKASKIMSEMTGSTYECDWIPYAPSLGNYDKYCAVVSSTNLMNECHGLSLEKCEKFEYCTIISY